MHVLLISTCPALHHCVAANLPGYISWEGGGVCGSFVDLDWWSGGGGGGGNFIWGEGEWALNMIDNVIVYIFLNSQIKKDLCSHW